MTWPTASLTSSWTSTRQPRRSAARAIASAIGPPPAMTSLVTGEHRDDPVCLDPSGPSSSPGLDDLGPGHAIALEESDELTGSRATSRSHSEPGRSVAAIDQAADDAALRQPRDQGVHLAQLDAHQPARPRCSRLTELPVKGAPEQGPDLSAARCQGKASSAATTTPSAATGQATSTRVPAAKQARTVRATSYTDASVEPPVHVHERVGPCIRCHCLSRASRRDTPDQLRFATNR